MLSAAGDCCCPCDLYHEPEGLTGVAAAREINKVPADRPSAEESIPRAAGISVLNSGSCFR
jgi:hypothetical protein